MLLKSSRDQIMYNLSNNVLCAKVTYQGHCYTVTK